MKKFLLFTVVLIGLLFVGFTAYFFMINNEQIMLSLKKGEVIYMNSGDVFDVPITWKSASSKTKVFENITVSDERVLQYKQETKSFVAVNGGVAMVTITPSNQDFGPFVFSVNVGDGRMETPFYITNAEQLAKIGKGTETFTFNQNYKVVKDIDLLGDEWTPIANFAGIFDGGMKKISNLKVETATTDAGLFASISKEATVKNVIMENAVLNGNFDYAGVIAAQSNGNINNCILNNATIINGKENSFNGGIAGVIQNSVDENGNYQNWANIEMCEVAISKSTSTSGNFGGLSGKVEGGIIFNNKVVINGYTSVDGTQSFGGLAGVVNNAKSATKYMFSVIKNNIITIKDLATDAASDSATIAAVAGCNTNDASGGYNNLFKNTFYNVDKGTLPVVKQGDVELVDVRSATMAELQDIALYGAFNFETIWNKADGSIPSLLIGQGNNEWIAEFIPGAAVLTEFDFWGMIDAIKKAPRTSNVYEIGANIEIDLAETEYANEWETIALYENNPLQASIICKEDCSLTIKNIVLTDNNPSIWGYVKGSNTVIDGVSFENVSYKNASNKTIGMVATKVLDSAKILNSTTKDIKMNTTDNVSFLGIFTSSNFGLLENITITNKEFADNEIITIAENIKYGTITVTNNSIINNVLLENINIIENNSSKESNQYFAAVCAENIDAAKILNAYTFDTKIYVGGEGIVRVGGIAVYTTNNSKISACYFHGSLETKAETRKSHVAGISCYVQDNALVETTYVNITKSTAHFFGGFAVSNKSTIDQCVSEGNFKGFESGGFTHTNNGIVSNSSSWMSLSADGTNHSKVCGFSVYIPYGGEVQYSFNACELIHHNPMTTCQETFAEIRLGRMFVINTLQDFIVTKKDFGMIRYSICDNFGGHCYHMSEAGPVKFLVGKLRDGEELIKATSDECKGITGDYKKFKDDAQFNQNLWTFDNNGGDGAYPTVTHNALYNMADFAANRNA